MLFVVEGKAFGCVIKKKGGKNKALKIPQRKGLDAVKMSCFCIF